MDAEETLQPELEVEKLETFNPPSRCALLRRKVKKMANIAEGSLALNLAAAALDHLIKTGVLDHQIAKRLIDEAAVATHAGMPNSPQAVEPYVAMLHAIVDGRRKKMLNPS